ncbi:hypothetical protein ACFSKI_16485 [Pseudogracilibacillus auburnensis]
MMKRFLILMLTAILFVGCSSPKEETANDSEGKEAEATEDAEDTEEEGGIEVEKGLFNVEITLPTSLFGEEELAEIEAEMGEEVSDITQNDDGSYTVKMTKKEHKELLAEMKDDLTNMITEVAEDEEFASIHDITYNDDFTKINMVVDQEMFENSFDGFVTLSLGVSSLFYQVFNGKDIEKEKVTISLEDAETKEVFSEIIYPDALEEMGEESE